MGHILVSMLYEKIIDISWSMAETTKPSKQDAAVTQPTGKPAVEYALNMETACGIRRTCLH